jgi:two-component system, sensor histidine kinase RegB
MRPNWLPPLDVSTDAAAAITSRTLITARWIAVAGQCCAVIISYFILDVHFPIWGALACVALSIVLNQYAEIVDRTSQISTRRTTGYLIYDVIQLSTLLAMTGGYTNPFTVFLMAPVTVAATLLPFRQTMLTLIVGIICILIISHFFIPLDFSTYGHSSHSVLLIGESLAMIFALIFASFFAWRTAVENRNLQRASMAAHSAIQRQRQVSALGAQAAAAAHELGSPLSTIAVIAKDLEDDLKNTQHSDDIALIRNQIQRCQKILQSLGHKDSDNAIFTLPPLRLDEFLRLIAAEFQIHNPIIEVNVTCENLDTLPTLPQRPELVHAFGVYIQNALEFARTSVTLGIEQTKNDIAILIRDDGDGFSSLVLNRLGQPFISSHALNDADHHGLGIFIAQTLLEHTGAQIHFSNSAQGGAVVRITWRKRDIENLTRDPS